MHLRCGIPHGPAPGGTAARGLQGGSLEQITAGDLTIRKSGNADPASNVLRNQAQLMIAPYLKDRFCFRGV